MELFEIVEHEKFDVIHCKKRKLELQVIHTDHIPSDIPTEALIVFGSNIESAFGKDIQQSSNLVSAFCVVNDDKIEYELFLIENLINNAINYYGKFVLGLKYNRLDYSPGYKAKYIDSRPTDLTKINPDLLAYIMRVTPEDGLDYYEWKEQRLN